MGANISETEPVEQLFLEFPIQDILTNRHGMADDPWAWKYVDAIRDGRLGDAIWARYHIGGDIEDDIPDASSKMTVLDVIKEDALGYRASEPEEYSKALLIYAKTSSTDGRPDIIDLIRDLDERDVAQMKERMEDENEESE
ncbi:hypothetical protein N7504_003191 [Penicillium tannophilum]|nr:hypothetical protein N7504_003191 [Penicillium tannophilum]